MIENFLKLSRSLTVAAHLRISQTTQIDWVENSKTRAEEECYTRDSEVVRSRRMRHFERLRRVTLAESVERPQGRRITELDRWGVDAVVARDRSSLEKQ